MFIIIKYVKPHVCGHARCALRSHRADISHWVDAVQGPHQSGTSPVDRARRNLRAQICAAINKQKRIHVAAGVLAVPGGQLTQTGAGAVCRQRAVYVGQFQFPGLSPQ